MHDPLEKLVRLSRDRHAERLAEAERARLLRAARSEPRWRRRAAEALVALAVRLSAEHRARLRPRTVPGGGE